MLLIDLLQSINYSKNGKKRNITKQFIALTDVTWQRANFNKEKTCVTPQSTSIQTCTLRIAFLAVSEKGCEKVKKPQ